ncbi:DNA-binding protein [Pseudomonas sp. MDT2-39-1]
MLTLTGLCHGFHTDNRTVGQNTFTENLILLEVQDVNQYGLPEVKTLKVKLSKKNMELGLNNVWNQYKGKAVSVPVFVAAWASKAGNAGFDFYLSGDGKPQNFEITPSKAS